MLASKPLKPFQGLKPGAEALRPILASKASKPLKPFQGLKPSVSFISHSPVSASKPLKPFQGLKRRHLHEYPVDTPLQSL